MKTQKTRTQRTRQTTRLPEIQQTEDAPRTKSEPGDLRRKQVARVVDALQNGLRHRDALKLGGMTWNEFQAALPHCPDLADIYGPIDAANTQGACMGFSYVCRLVGRQYRDILPQIAEPHMIVDRQLLDKARDVARLLKYWIESVEKIDREKLL